MEEKRRGIEAFERLVSKTEDGNLVNRPGSCKKCGKAGHLTFECYNSIKLPPLPSKAKSIYDRSSTPITNLNELIPEPTDEEIKSSSKDRDSKRKVKKEKKRKKEKKSKKSSSKRRHRSRSLESSSNSEFDSETRSKNRGEISPAFRKLSYSSNRPDRSLSPERTGRRSRYRSKSRDRTVSRSPIRSSRYNKHTEDGRANNSTNKPYVNPERARMIAKQQDKDDDYRTRT